MAAAVKISGFVPSNLTNSALLLLFLSNVFLATLLLSSPPSATTTTDPAGTVLTGSHIVGDCSAGFGGSGGKDEAAPGEAAAATAAAAAWRSMLRVEGGVAEDPWFIGKAVPPPDDCKCAGYVIEKLEPEYNFRRPFVLGFDPALETKIHLMPYLRAFQDLSLRTAKRRILLDLGGHHFGTSVTWFLQYYPLDFTEVHVFEVRKGMFRVPRAVPVPLLAASDSSACGVGDEHQGGVMSNITCLLDDRSRARRDRKNKSFLGPFPFPAWELSRIHLYECLVGLVDNDSSSSSSNDDDGGDNATRSPDKKRGDRCLVNITRFIKEELRVAPDDALIVKMDVEGSEWDILPLWMSDAGDNGAGGIGASMVELVDELFVEVHYHHPTMYRYFWTPKIHQHSIEEATQLLRDLRSRGFFVHAWP